MINPQVTYEKPKEFTLNNVMYWEETSQKLRYEKKGKALLSKAKKFIAHDCIRRSPTSLTSWECLPIKDYNKTTHRINSTDHGWTCTCQGFHKSLTICSHILAVKQVCFLEANK